MSDWSVLGLGSDPVPGDPFRVRGLAGRLAGLASLVENNTSRLSGITGGGGGDLRMVGDYAAAYVDALVTLPGDLSKLGVGYRRCSEVLSVFAGSLETAKQQAGSALSAGVDADARMQSALRQIRYALPADRQAAFASGLSLSAVAVESATTGLDESVRAQVRSAFARGRTALADRDRARRLAEQAARLRGEAETRCVRGIEDALDSSGMRNKSWWEKAWDFVSAPFRSWDAFIDLCKNIAMVAGIVAMFISGPIGLAIMAIALVAGALVLLDSIHKAATGQGSWWEVGFNLLGVIPGGRGVISVSKMGRGALGLVKTFARGEGGRLLLGGLKTFGRAALTKGRNMVTALPHALSTAKSLGAGALRDPRLFARAFKCRWVGRDPIDMASGEMVMAMTDLTLPGTLPFALTRTYLSSQRGSGWFGPGWTSPLDHRLEHTQTGLALSWVQGMVLLYPHPTRPDTPVMPVEGPRIPLVMDAAGRYQVSDPESGRTLHFPAVPAAEVTPVAEVARTAEGGVASSPTAASASIPTVADSAATSSSLCLPSPRTGEGQVAAEAGAGWVLPLAKVVDRFGNRISLGYDAETGDLALVEHSGGYTLDVAAVAGRVTGVWLRGRPVMLPDGEPDVFVREPDVPLVRYGYDDGGRLTEVVNSTGLPTKFTYDTEDRMTGWEDRNGTWYAYTYDADGRVIGTNGSAGCLDGAITYDTDARVTVEENSLGARTRYEFDEGYRITRVVDPVGHATSYSWDRFDRKLSETNALGETTSWVYDEAGHPTQVTGPDGAVTRVVYDEQGYGLPVRVIQADGTVWVYERDEHGLPVHVIDHAGSVTAYTWAEHGHLTAVTDPLGNTTNITPDPAGLPTTVTDPAGAVTSYARDGLGRVTTVTDPAGGVTSLVWSVEGDLVQQTGPDGAVRQWVYDGERNLVRHVDALGQTTTTEYTHFDLPAARTLPDGSRTVFGYDTELRLTAVTNALGDVWTYTFDPAGRLIGETDYTGRTLTNTYDPAGRLAERVNGAGETLTYERDPAGRVVCETAATPSRVATTEYAYDPLGRLVSATNPDAALAFTRDVLGRVTAETVNGSVLALDLDPLGRVTTRTTPSGDVTTWAYGPTGLPETLTTGGHTLAFTHDPLGRETTRTLDTGLTITSAWDTAGRLAEQAITAPTTAIPVPAGLPGTPGLPPAPGTATEHRLVNRRKWSYRADNNPVRVEDGLAGTTTFDLDPLGRITQAVTPHGVEAYTYDANNNPLTATWPTPDGAPSGAPTGTVGADGEPDTAAAIGDRAYTRGRITRAGRTSYTHDGQGRLTTRRIKTLSGQIRQWQYGWDAHDRLVTVTTPDHITWRYRYDALGRRIAKQRLDADGQVAAQVTFTWHGPVLIEQTIHAMDPRGAQARSTTTWTYLPGTWRPLTQTRRTWNPGRGDLGRCHPDHSDQSPPSPTRAEREQPDKTRFHVIATDLVGTPTELVTPAGAITWSRQATTYDVPLSGERDTAVCPLRFPGQYHDPETGQNYNHHRTYDPTTTTYTSTDPLGLAPAPNPATYVTNPTTWTDPLGLTPYGMAREGKIFENQLPHDLGQELRTAEHLGVTPSRVGTPAFDRAIDSGTIKWAIREDGTLVVVPKHVQGIEIKHTVLTGGGPVLAAGEAEVAGSAGSYFGIEINNNSGHYLPSTESLGLGKQRFSSEGVEFP